MAWVVPGAPLEGGQRIRAVYLETMENPAFDLMGQDLYNPGVPLWKGLAASLFLLALAGIPQWLGLGAHASAGGHSSEWSALAESLVHGHEHGEDVPDHEHRLLPSPTFRPVPPRDLQAPAIAVLETPEAEGSPLSKARLWPGRIGFSSSSPPRLHLLCSLLI